MKNFFLKKKVFLIAEIGINHNGSLKKAIKLVDAAIEAGVSAVKFQTYKTELRVKKDSPIFSILKKCELSNEDFFIIKKYCDKKKIIFFSTPFDIKSIEFLEKINVKLYKVSSFDISNFQLINRVLQTKKPIIFSTGMGTLKEIDLAVKFFKKNKKNDIAILHCTSCYPPKNNEVNLNNIIGFKKRFKTVVGYSDHTNDNYAAFASVTLGAKIIEKHITLNKKYPGPDHPFSIEPKEMKDLIYGIRKIEETLGSNERNLSGREFKNRLMIRRSIVAKNNISKGSVIKENDIKYARPGTGISITQSKKIINKIAKKNIKSETLIKYSMIKK